MLSLWIMELNIETIREYCLNKGPVTEHFPFDNRTLVFKIGNKSFAFTDVEDFEFINLKCDPERAIELRERYPEAVKPGWHMNKKHWNSVYPNAGLPIAEFLKLIDHSYELIIQSLPLKVRKEIDDET